MVDYDPPLCVFTSDKYMRCLPIWCHLFNKYWHDYREKNVVILGYSVPKFKDWDFPSNIKYFSLGEHQPVERWSNKILEFLQTQKFDHIQWCTEDSFLTHPVNFSIYFQLMAELTDSTVGRIALTNDFQAVTRKHTVIKKLSDFSLLEADKNAKNRICGTWSLFSRECFFKVIKPNMSPWDLEDYSNPNYNIEDNVDFRILGAGNNWPLRTTCAIRTTGKYQKLKIKPDQRPLMLQPINEEPANHFGFQSREFPDDTFQELKDLNFIDDECKMTIKLETPVQ